jgi:hypothetical protein
MLIFLLDLTNFGVYLLHLLRIFKPAFAQILDLLIYLVANTPLGPKRRCKCEPLRKSRKWGSYHLAQWITEHLLVAKVDLPL